MVRCTGERKLITSPNNHSNLQVDVATVEMDHYFSKRMYEYHYRVLIVSTAVIC